MLDDDKTESANLPGSHDSPSSQALDITEDTASDFQEDDLGSRANVKALTARALARRETSRTFGNITMETR